MREKLEDSDERRDTARPVTAIRAVAGRCNFNALITARYLLLQFKIINTNHLLQWSLIVKVICTSITFRFQNNLISLRLYLNSWLKRRQLVPMRTESQTSSARQSTVSTFKSLLVILTNYQYNETFVWVGQGKFSYVFRAKRVSDNVLVALKLIKVCKLDLLIFDEHPILLHALVDLWYGQREAKGQLPQGSSITPGNTYSVLICLQSRFQNLNHYGIADWSFAFSAFL